jgi:hypothetical protein
MTSLVLGDLILESITPSVNAPLLATKCLTYLVIAYIPLLTSDIVCVSQLQPHQSTNQCEYSWIMWLSTQPQVDQPLETCYEDSVHPWPSYQV